MLFLNVMLNEYTLGLTCSRSEKSHSLSVVNSGCALFFLIQYNVNLCCRHSSEIKIRIPVDNCGPKSNVIHKVTHRVTRFSYVNIHSIIFLFSQRKKAKSSPFTSSFSSCSIRYFSDFYFWAELLHACYCRK